MPLLDKLPTDHLYKFLTVVGLAVVMTSIVLPVGALWNLQIQRNQAEGDEAENNLKRDALLTEIATLKAKGQRDLQQSEETLRRMNQMIDDIVKSPPNPKGTNPLSMEETQRLAQIQVQVVKLLEEIEKLQQGEQPDLVAIRIKNGELDNLVDRLTKGMPADQIDATHSAMKALRLNNELDLLSTAAKPDNSLVVKKRAEVTAALEEAKKKTDAVQVRRDGQKNQERADFVSQAFQAFTQVMVLHTDLLRFQNLVRESGAQMTEKVTEFKIAEIKLATKKKELDIVSQHNTIAIAGGIAGLLVGLTVSIFGFWWWYQAEGKKVREGADLLRGQGKTPDHEAVRTRAHCLWEAAGCPPGDGTRFWMAAERELRDAQTVPAQPSDSPAPVG